MKALCFAVAAVVLLAGCGHDAGVSGAPSSGISTYASHEFHFSIDYDPSQFEASPHPMPSVHQLNLTLRLGKALAGLHYGSDDVFVSTASTDAGYVQNLLVEWGKADHPTWDAWTMGNNPSSAGWTASWTTLGGARGMLYERTSGSRHSVCYLLFHGRQAYSVSLRSDTSQSSTVEPLLNEVIQSFRVAN